MTTKGSLDIKKLYHVCDPEQFKFETTEDLEPMEGVLGQEHAMEAIQFAVDIQRKGYHLFIIGSAGIGKHTVVNNYLKKHREKKPSPCDWCYVYNFKDPLKPKAIQLSPGLAIRLRNKMETAINELISAIPADFDNEAYHNKRKFFENELKSETEKLIDELRKEAEISNIALIKTDTGYGFAPIRHSSVMTTDDFDRLDADIKKDFENQIQQLQKKLEHTQRKIKKFEEENKAKIRQLDHDTASTTVESKMGDFKTRCEGSPDVLMYLEEVKQDVIQNAETFKTKTTDKQVGENNKLPFFKRYHINVFIEHEHDDKLPIVYEDIPTYQRLVGRMEHISHMGMLSTDFTLIKPGALHRANGGYLILDADKLLTQPHAWDGLKRALQSGEVKIESLEQRFSWVSTVMLQPDVIPLDVKVILMGDRKLYYKLYEHDQYFSELFKVTANFDTSIERNKRNHLFYARSMASLIQKESLRPCDKQAVAQIIEHCSRLAGDNQKVTIHMAEIADLLRESDYWASQKKRKTVCREDVEKTLLTRIQRSDFIKQKIHDEIHNDTILIKTTGEAIAEINGLTIITLGGYTFGRPNRITATTRFGDGKVVDIEREVELGLNLHSKGVLILSSLLGSRYAKHTPLSLCASIVFEQSYGTINGDSASMAEFCAIISSLSNIPIKQCLAITGSVNQHGKAQPIGGVNEKIEGYFDVCQQRGLSNDQGVIIPGENIKNLMLNKKVRDAVKAKQFHIYAVDNVDQALEILTGVTAGKPDEHGNFPDSTINRRVVNQLMSWAEKKMQIDNQRLQIYQT